MVVKANKDCGSGKKCVGSGVIEIRDKQPTVAMYCHDIPAIFFGGKHDLIQLQRLIIH